MVAHCSRADYKEGTERYLWASTSQASGFAVCVDDVVVVVVVVVVVLAEEE